MGWTDDDVAKWLDDDQKIVTGDIVWKRHAKAGRSFKFDAMLRVGTGEQMKVRGFSNDMTQKLSFTIVGEHGRLYSLCIGPRVHMNPDGILIRGTHKHRYTSANGAQDAYNPSDITAEWNEPQKAWAEFCNEARISHEGNIAGVPELDQELF